MFQLLSGNFKIKVEFSIEIAIRFVLKSIWTLIYVRLEVKFGYFYKVNQWEFCIDLIHNRVHSQLLSTSI